MDEAGRFTVNSDEFAALVGPRTTSAIGRPWADMAAELGLDPPGQVARALATRDTWSGLGVTWPVDDSPEPLTVELSGLPVFDRERTFRGYRGFGVCRDVGRLAALAQRRQTPPAEAKPAPEDAANVAPEEAAPPPASADTIAAGSAPAAAAPVRLPERARLVENVVPFRSATEPGVPALSAIERNTFRELSRKLSQRLTAAGIKHNDASAIPAADEDQSVATAGVEAQAFETQAFEIGALPIEAARGTQPMLDKLAVGVLIYRLDQLIYANPAFLQWSGHAGLDALVAAGGLDELFVGPLGAATASRDKPLKLALDRGDRISVASELIPIHWDGEPAQALVIAKPDGELARPEAEPANTKSAQTEIAELKSALDIATDGVVIIDRQGRIMSANRSAQALFGYEAQEISGRAFDDLFAAESIDAAHACLDDLVRDAAPPGGGREVVGLRREGGTIGLLMTIGHVGDGVGKLCAVFRDLTAWKKSEEDLVAAKRQAENASSAKSDFLAKVSHEIRTPLNAIIGFSEVIMEERFGPIANERYRDYLKDIHASGGHLLSLVNDLLDLSKIEAGKLELSFTSVALNDLTQQCVAIMQPQASRERIIIRTSLPQTLPQVVADARSLRQIVLNLLSNSIKFTGAGGQVIVSTARDDNGEVVLRVRDTGVGMSEKDLLTALEPFRQIATSAHSGGTGLGLPLTKALAEANRASFHIKSAPKEGTLVEIIFPANRVLAG
jgi:PAS domain S-box-containing protein